MYNFNSLLALNKDWGPSISIFTHRPAIAFWVSFVIVWFLTFIFFMWHYCIKCIAKYLDWALISYYSTVEMLLKLFKQQKSWMCEEQKTWRIRRYKTVTYWGWTEGHHILRGCQSAGETCWAIRHRVVQRLPFLQQNLQHGNQRETRAKT